jgi:hypothetical protein
MHALCLAHRIRFDFIAVFVEKCYSEVPRYEIAIFSYEITIFTIPPPARFLVRRVKDSHYQYLVLKAGLKNAVLWPLQNIQQVK